MLGWVESYHRYGVLHLFQLGVNHCMLGSEMGKILLPIMTQIQFETNVSLLGETL